MVKKTKKRDDFKSKISKLRNNLKCSGNSGVLGNLFYALIFFVFVVLDLIFMFKLFRTGNYEVVVMLGIGLIICAYLSVYFIKIYMQCLDMK